MWVCEPRRAGIFNTLFPLDSSCRNVRSFKLELHFSFSLMLVIGRTAASTLNSVEYRNTQIPDFEQDFLKTSNTESVSLLS